MKINWKVRLKNKMFWVQVYLSVFVPILAYAGITEQDLVTWNALWDLIVMAISNPFVLFSALIGIFNALIDNTTPGIQDSDRVMNYNSVKDSMK